MDQKVSVDAKQEQSAGAAIFQDLSTVLKSAPIIKRELGKLVCSEIRV